MRIQGVKPYELTRTTVYSQSVDKESEYVNISPGNKEKNPGAYRKRMDIKLHLDLELTDPDLEIAY